MRLTVYWAGGFAWLFGVLSLALGDMIKCIILCIALCSGVSVLKYYSFQRNAVGSLYKWALQ
jgi:hypothetical protein